MNTSSFQIAQESGQFLLKNLRIIPVLFLFNVIGGLTFAIFAALCAGIVWLFIGSTRFLGAINIVIAGSFALITPWILIALVGIFFIFLLCCMFYPRVCGATYILHLLRDRKITCISAARKSFRLVTAAWRVAGGMAAVPVALLAIGGVLIVTHALLALAFAVGAILFMLWFFMAAFYMEQLVADGNTRFRATLITSWNYVKRSWWQIGGVMFFLWLANVIVSLALKAVLFSIVGVILNAWYTVAVNKMYLIVKTEPEYKYSSE